MGIFRNKESDERNVIESVFLPLLNQDKFFIVHNSMCIVDLGFLSVANQNFPPCKKCWDAYLGDSRGHKNKIPDCNECGRSINSVINLPTGNGDGLYAVFGLAPNKQSDGLPPFEGAVMDFRVFDSPDYMSLSNTDQIFPLDPGAAEIFKGDSVLNIGSLSVEGKLYFSDIVATSNDSRMPVVCDLNVIPGMYNLFAIMGKIDGQDQLVIKTLVILHESHTRNLVVQYPYNSDWNIEMEIAREGYSTYMLTGDHHSQCFLLNYAIAQNWGTNMGDTSRIMDGHSWLIAGKKAGVLDETGQQELKNVLETFNITDEEQVALLSRRLPQVML